MIGHAQARRIACEWHGGGGSALYALCSTGAIDTARADHDLVAEINDNIQAERNTLPTERADPMGLTNLVNLRTYVRKHGKRGPVEGWSHLEI